MTRGVISWGAYLPYRRISGNQIEHFIGERAGTGSRSVASYDEDATTLGVEAARYALKRARGIRPSSICFATTAPPYGDKTNAVAIHAALRLARSAPAYDMVGAVRSTIGALRAGLSSGGPCLVVAADLRTGLPGSTDERMGGDAGAAVVVGDADDGRIVAELLACGAATEEFTDRWRTPGSLHSHLWEERFAESRYLDLGVEAWTEALETANLTCEDVDHLIVVSTHPRAAARLPGRLGVHPEKLVDDHVATIGNTGAAAPTLLLASALETSSSGDCIALVVLADGADVILLRATDALQTVALPTVAEQAARGGPLAYGKFLAWRGFVTLEPPRRAEPMRPSSAAAARSVGWKFGYVGSEGPDGTLHLPPAPTDTRPHPMADSVGTVVTFTVDRLAYSPSPPIVFAIVDFDGGGRSPVELTDLDPDDAHIGMRVEMTFRKLFTADDIHNYFWKARPLRGTPITGE